MADFNEYKGVWVFCEQRQGALMSTDFELVSEARKLADELGCEVTGLLLGDNVEGIAKELGGYGADKVMVCDSPLLKDYTTDAYAKVVCDMVNEYKPEVLLIGATNIGRDLGPRCAARLHTGTAQCRAGQVLLAVTQESRIPRNVPGKGRVGQVLDMAHEIAFFIGTRRDEPARRLGLRINRTRHCSPARPAGRP